MIFSFTALAQPYNSRLGRFQVDQKKGCASFPLTLTNLLPGNCGMFPCTVTWGDASAPQQGVSVHTYTNPGTYTLSVLYGGNLGSDDIIITVVPSIQPNFEIHACAGNSAVIKVVDNAYDQYVIDFKNDGSPDFTLPFSNNIVTPAYAYVPIGPQTPSVRGRNLNSLDNCATMVQSFNTLATLPTPSINTLVSVDNSNITLTFTTATNIQYRLEVAVNNSGIFQVFKVLYGVNNLAITNLNLTQNYYCYRLGAYNPCTGTSTYSNTSCTSRLTVTAQSDVNVVTWATGPAVNYSISRDNTPYVTIGTPTFNDTDAECKTTYCYRVTNNYGSGRTSVSLEKCVTAFSNTKPTAIDNVSSVVSAAGASMTWTQDPLFTPQGYSILRSSEGGNYALYAAAPASPFADPGYATSGKFCYRINYVDKCENASGAGSAICPVQLTGELSQTNSITLSWTGYKGWKNGVKDYTLRKYGLAGNLLKTVTQADSIFLDDQPDPANQYVRYEVTANPNQLGQIPSVSNNVEIIKNANLYYPTAFTPNNDQLNDGFIVTGQFIVRINMTIYDRWGALLYASDKREPWDGHSNGKAMPASVYIWKTEITDLAGRTFSQEGTVALIRN